MFAASAVLLLASPLITSAWTTTTPPGSQTYGTPGSYNFVVPENAGDITVEVWGGGQYPVAYGPFLGDTHGAAGGTSSFGSVVAGGGHMTPGDPVAGGVASGGDINITGNPPIQAYPGYVGIGGNAPFGGIGGFAPNQTVNPNPAGQQPGGGGGNIGCSLYICWDRGGASGGYAKKTYAAGTLAAGTIIQVVVGAGGQEGGSKLGGDGMVKVNWTGATVNDPEPQPQVSAFTQSTTATQNPSVGGSATISTTIKNIGGATNALIDIEVYQNGTKVGQKFFDNQLFSTNQSRTYTYPFTVPSAGAYTVSIGVFHAGWAGMHTWFDQVASFTAVSGGGGGGQSLSIYQDALAQGWENWSWGSTQNFSDASLVFSGTRAMKVTYNAPWGGLFLHHAGVNTTGKSTLNFAIAGGGAGGQNLQIYTSDSNGVQSLAKNLSQYIAGGIAANTWKQVSIPLADIGAANKMLGGIVIQDVSGNVGASIYIDAMQIQ